MLPLETATDAKTPSQHPRTRISTNCEDFFEKQAWKCGLEWSGGAETLPIITTIERNNWAKSEDDLSTLGRRTKEFQSFFSTFFDRRRSPKKRWPPLQRAGSRSSGEIFARNFFIPLVQSEFYQEIIKAWLQYPGTGARRRSNRTDKPTDRQTDERTSDFGDPVHKKP